MSDNNENTKKKKTLSLKLGSKPLIAPKRNIEAGKTVIVEKKRYKRNPNSENQFQWTNIFLSLESRQEFIESWQSLEISKEIQAMLLEQSICQPSKIYRRYKVI